MPSEKDTWQPLPWSHQFGSRRRHPTTNSHRLAGGRRVPESCNTARQRQKNKNKKWHIVFFFFFFRLGRIIKTDNINDFIVLGFFFLKGHPSYVQNYQPPNHCISCSVWMPLKIRALNEKRWPGQHVRPVRPARSAARCLLTANKTSWLSTRIFPRLVGGKTKSYVTTTIVFFERGTCTLHQKIGTQREHTHTLTILIARSINRSLATVDS